MLNHNIPIEVDENEVEELDMDFEQGGAIRRMIHPGTTSVSSSVRNYRNENGRRYHGFRDGAYFMPNDKREQDRMDLEHRIFQLLMKGKLHRAPLGQDEMRALDLGCGTGNWTVDFAHEYPKCQILGTDLSPIQHLWVPENCVFEIDDFEEEWQYHESNLFNYIHSRNLAGCISNYTTFFNQAYKNLLPGGYLEMQSFEANFYSPDGTRERAVTATLWQKLLVSASQKFGKSLDVEHTWKAKMIEAGFVDVVEEVIKVPFNKWPKDPHLKQIGRYQASHMAELLESWSMALFTRVLGWTTEELDVLFVAVKNDFSDPKTHLYGKVRLVYGRKPE
ncbi:hypothetical protein FQN57_001195 [Myotisia sp. PD_48]|nr:hypothetical protein FQN57_001195 [Myotisia sp. PD_48]